jgi:hypothetical protein
MAHHTLTPWTVNVSQTTYGEYWIEEVLAEPEDGADAIATDHANAALIEAAVNACGQVNPENPIAAANALPDLLEAAIECLAEMDKATFFDGNTAPFHRLYSAIRKATGKE